MSRVEVGYARAVDSAGAWSLAPKFRWTESDADPEILNKALSATNARITSEIQIGKREKFDADSLTHGEVVAKCKSLHTKFIDVEFPPTEKALVSKKTDVKAKVVQWRRASEFLGSDVALFSGGIEPNDIKQGELGDCWLLCAFSALAEFPEEVKRIFCLPGERAPQGVNDAGVYDLQLCLNGTWHRVRIDDYFPCKYNGDTIYARAHGPELWVLLLEKAFAKTCGDYNSLRSGWAYEALMDLTGAPTTKIFFDDDRTKADIESGKLWSFLVAMDQANNLITCSTAGQDKWTEGGGVPVGGPGLVSGHAYTLIQARNTSSKQRLVQLRNPWGDFEWNGDWSDESPLWTPKLKAELNFESNPGDGKFWMAFEDFVHFFNGVNVCRVFAEPARAGLPATRWIEHRERGRFFFKNHELTTSAYKLTVTTATKGWISVHQQDVRDITAKPYIDIGVSVLASDRKTLVASTGIDVDRQVQLEVDLPAGTYYVVPYTTGCKFEVAQLEDGDPVDKLVSGGSLTADAEVAVREIFNRYDIDLDLLLNRAELNGMFRELTGKDFTEEEYRKTVKSCDNRNGELTPDGLVQYFEQLGSTPSGVAAFRALLNAAGYDADLDLCHGRGFVLSIHSVSKVVIAPEPADTELLEEAIERPIVAFGRCTNYDGGKFAIFDLRSGYNGVSLAAKNLFNLPLEVTVKCKAVNALSHTGSLNAMQRIEPGHVEIMHHLMPIKEERWSWAYSVEWKFIRA